MMRAVHFVGVILALHSCASVAIVPNLASYCDGQPSVSNDRLYDEPPCDLRTVQRPGPSDDVAWAGYRLAGLDFCCNANFTALLPVGTNVTEKDEEARWLYEAAAQLIERFDCPAFYPFQTCEPCLAAYRTWLCATVFPMKCLGEPVALQVCNDVCLEVRRKCPTELGFTCPLDSGTQDGGDGVYGAWGAGGNVQLFGAGGCNPMHYNLGPGSPYSSNEEAPGLTSAGAAPTLDVALLAIAVAAVVL